MKKEQSTLGTHMIKILKKMCSIVGAKYSQIDFANQKWFMKYKWDLKTEQKFRVWMCDYLKNNISARKEMIFPSKKDSKSILGVVDFFIFQYGWTYTKNVTWKEKTNNAKLFS